MKSASKWQGVTRRRIYLMRHGDVDYFDETGRPFQPATVPLNSQGRLQAEEAARVLSGASLDRVLTSDLERSLQTANIVIGQRKIPPQMRQDLREIQPARLADIAQVGPEQIEDAFLNAFGPRLSRETRFLGGETFGSLSDRVQACLNELLLDKQWRHLLIVAHGGVNRVILSHALKLGLESIGVLEQDPGCINILDVDENANWIVRLMNFTPWSPAKAELQLTTMEKLYLQYLGEVMA